MVAKEMIAPLTLTENLQGTKIKIWEYCYLKT